MVLDWSGITTRAANMVLDVKKAVEEKTKSLINYLGIGGAVLVVIGIYFLFKKK